VQETAFNNLAATSSEFVPKGHFRTTDESFPEFDSFDPAPKKKTKETQPVKIENAPTEEE
jgi:hypothetical protein